MSDQETSIRRTRDIRTLAGLAAVPWVLSLYLLLWDIPQNLRPAVYGQPTSIHAEADLPELTRRVIGLSQPVPCMIVMLLGTAGVVLALRTERKAVAWAALVLGATLLVGLYLGGYYLLESARTVREVLPPGP